MGSSVLRPYYSLDFAEKSPARLLLHLGGCSTLEILQMIFWGVGIAFCDRADRSSLSARHEMHPSPARPHIKNPL